MSVDARTLESIAVDEVDVLVYRRIASGRYAHLGGLGRGEGWAGIVEIELSDEPGLARALSTGTVQTVHEDTARRVVGPYWATDAAIVPINNDEFVVVGGSAAVTADAERCVAIAHAVSEQVDEVSPAKRLADELEMLHAVRDVALTTMSDLGTVAADVTRAAVEALSCEIGILHLPELGVTVVHADDATHRPPVGEAGAWCDYLLPATTGQLRCVQDATDIQRHADTAWGGDVLSFVAVPLSLDTPALLVLAHTTKRPRGFTQLCRAIARSIADAAGVVLLASMATESLRSEVKEARMASRTDELTGLLNRRGWRDALDGLRDTDGPVSAIVCDVNYLKVVNDREGHEAGDELIRAAGRALTTVVRYADPVARVGGDEFAVLLAGVDQDRCDQILERVRFAADRGEPSVSIAIGAATAADRSDLDDLVCRADTAMYRDKGTRRR